MSYVLHNLNEVKTKITAFERELLSMIPTVKFVDMFNRLKHGELCAYMPRKEQVIFTCDLPRVSHEIAHMVEMNDFNRITKDDWALGFDYTSGRSHRLINANYVFVAATRECRVKAIESFLCKSQYQIGRVLNNNWYDGALYPQVSDNKTFGRFKTTKQIDEWLLHIFDSTQKKWSIDRIHHEWKRRIKHLRNWQETNTN